MSWVSQWPFDEASSGTSPTTAGDSEASPVDLAITFAGAGAWTTDSGNGIAVDSSATYAQTATLLGTKLDFLEGATTFSIEIVASLASDLNDLVFTLSGSSEILSIAKHWISSSHVAIYFAPNSGEFVWDTSGLGSGPHHFLLVYDSTEATDTDRLRLYVDGTLRTLTINGGTLPSSNQAIDLASDTRVTFGAFTDGTFNWPAQIYWGAIADHAVDSTEASARSTALLADNDADPAGNSIEFVQAALEISAATVTLTTSPTITADPGALEIAAPDVTLTGPGASITAAPAALELSANTVALAHGLEVDAGSFSIEADAPDVGLLPGFGLVADAVALELTGTDTALLRALQLVADQRALELTGADVALPRGLLFAADQAALELVAAAVGLLRGVVLPADQRAMELAAAAVNLNAGNVLTVDPTGLDVAAPVVGLLRGLLLLSDTATLDLDAALVTLTGPGNILQIDPSALELSAPETGLQRALRLLSGPAALDLDAADTSLPVMHRLTADPAALDFDGADVALSYFSGNVLTAEQGDLDVAGSSTGLFAALTLQAEIAAIELTGADALLYRGVAPLVVDVSPIDVAAQAVELLRALRVPVTQANLELVAATVALVGSNVQVPGRVAITVQGLGSVTITTKP